MTTILTEVAEEATGEQGRINSDRTKDWFSPKTATWDEFVKWDKSVTHSYRRERCLQFLYEIAGWTQSRIGERYNVRQSTISRWMDRHEIEKRNPDCHNEDIAEVLVGDL